VGKYEGCAGSRLLDLPPHFSREFYLL
jgi:hypothetical protein